MKLHILFLALVFQFSLFTDAIGQSKAVAKSFIAKQYSNYENTNASLNHLNYFEKMADEMQFAEQTKMALKEVVPGENGFVHYKFQQFHDGLPLFGGTYILHEKNGVVVRASGNYSPKIDINTKPSMNAASALNFAKQTMKADKYAEAQPSPVLCLIDRAFPKVSEAVKLAYQVDLTSTEPFDKRRIFLDAHSGKVISQFPLILQEGVPSTAKTRYYGTQSIVTDSLGPNNFRLHDPTRGEGISVFRTDLTHFTNTSSNWDLTNADQDEVALDAHYCSQEYFDLMKEDFEWIGLDGNGKALKVQVHNNGAGDVNAFWDGEYSNYGDGNCIYGPLTTLEVVGHEFTHGMIDYTSKLVYSSESGAINESLADIFGKILERKTDPANFDWDLGHSFLLSPEAKPFRVMDDPASVDMPDFYKGALWFDFSGVHTNSSIGNLWFTMIVDGKQGTNEAGYNYNVPALGMDKAGQIVFLTNRAYLTENSNYQQFHTYSMQAAGELYGDGSAEQLAVEEAWKAVGLPAPPSQALDLGLSATYDINNVCGFNGYLPIAFEIVNQGGVTYVPSMGAVVTLVDLDGNLSDLPIAIDEPIAPGEKIAIQVDDWFIANSPGIYFTNIELTFVGDEDANNNYTWNAYEVVEFDANDLELSTFFGPQTCFSPVVETTFRIWNESCETLPAGTILTLSAKDAVGSVIRSAPYTLENELVGFGLESYTTDIDFSSAPAGEPIQFAIDYAADPNMDNNGDEEEYPLLKEIDVDYLNSFNIDPSLDDYFDIQFFFSDPIVSYQDELYFASTGLYDDPETFVHCPDYLANFEPEFWSGINATMRACVDYSASQESFLEFDLVQFRNDFAQSENYEYSSMLQAKWEGNQSGQVIVNDQEEGQLEHHSYQLPPYFKGELKLKFYTEIGEWEIDSTNFETDDFLLIDNLKLLGTFSSTDDVLRNESVSVSPNPTNGNITIKSIDAIQAISLYDISGQLIKTVKLNATIFDFDMYNLSEGFYLLNVQMANGDWAIEKVIKLD